MNQELFNKLTEALHTAYYDESMEAKGSVEYLEAMVELSELYPELREKWWQDNRQRFNREAD